MASEKIEVTAEPASFEDFMRGMEHQEGGQHDLYPRGMASVPQDQPVFEDNHTVEPVANRLPEQQFNQQSHQFGQPAPQEQDWKRLYGQSENEKGDLRRELAQLREEINAIRTVQQPQVQPYAYQYQPQPQWQQQAPQAYEQAPQKDFFGDKSDEDAIEAGEMRRLLREVLAPAVVQLNSQQLALYQQQVAAQKAAAGITPSVEQRLVSSRPWLNSIPDGLPRIQAMQEILRQEPVQQPVQPPAQQPVPPHQAAVRRVTYVEPGTGQTNTPLMDPEERFKQEWAKARTSAEKRELLKRFGVGHVNDFGPSFYTR